jgi:hypothetical protein
VYYLPLIVPSGYSANQNLQAFSSSNARSSSNLRGCLSSSTDFLIRCLLKLSLTWKRMWQKIYERMAIPSSILSAPNLPLIPKGDLQSGPAARNLFQ